MARRTRQIAVLKVVGGVVVAAAFAGMAFELGRYMARVEIPGEDDQ